MGREPTDLNCPICHHRAHSRSCGEMIDNGWNRYGCHCNTDCRIFSPQFVKLMADPRPKCLHRNQFRLYARTHYCIRPLGHEGSHLHDVHPILVAHGYIVNGELV
jgi:hypothetical protein